MVTPIDGKQVLERLPGFKAIKVSSKSLKTTMYRRFVRDIEFQLNISNAVFGNDSDEDDFLKHLKSILENQGFNTIDLEETLIVIGNHSGALSSATFNIANAERFYTDLNAFQIDYPIFLDTSATRIIESERNLDDLKRERSDGDETIQFLPGSKKLNTQTIEDLQAHWLELEEQYKKQIEVLQTREGKALEHNAELTELCQQREKELEASLEECSKNEKHFEREMNKMQDEIRTLKVEPMSMTNRSDFLASGLEDEPIQRAPPNQTMITPERPTKPKVGSRLSGLFGGFLDPMVSNDDAEIKKLQGRNLTLAKFGLSVWNPDTTSFYDYHESFYACLSGHTLTHQEYSTLLFSALPSKYSYLRAVVVNHKTYNANNSDTTVSILADCLLGGKEKQFADFQKLQRKQNQSFLEYFQNCKTRYMWYTGTMPLPDDDENAFRSLKDKMVNAYPTLVAQEFKRRLEGKTTLTNIFNAILDVADNNPNIEEVGNNNGEIYALKMKNENWQKTVRCYECGKMGHIRRFCKQREGKTKKSGRKDE